jgi:hypothetical protein
MKQSITVDELFRYILRTTARHSSFPPRREEDDGDDGGVGQIFVTTINIH